MGDNTQRVCTKCDITFPINMFKLKNKTRKAYPI